MPTELEEVNFQIKLACKAEKVHVKEEVVELLASRDEEDYVHVEVVVHLTSRLSNIAEEVHEQNQVVLLLDNEARDLVQVVVMVLLDNMADEVFMQVEVVVFDNTELRRSMYRQRFRGFCDLYR